MKSDEARAREIVGPCEMSALGPGIDCLSTNRQRVCDHCSSVKWIAAYAADVRREERERCARIATDAQPCDEVTHRAHWDAYRVVWTERRETCLKIAAAIRSGESTKKEDNPNA